MTNSLTGRGEPCQDQSMTTHHTDFDTMAAANAATVASWVRDASAGLLTAERRPHIYSGWAIVRADGAPLDGTEAVRYGVPITGMGCDIDFSTCRRMDRRWTRAMTDVRDAVRTVLVRYIADPPMSAYSALSNFEHRNHLR